MGFLHILPNVWWLRTIRSYRRRYCSRYNPIKSKTIQSHGSLLRYTLPPAITHDARSGPCGRNAERLPPTPCHTPGEEAWPPGCPFTPPRHGTDGQRREYEARRPGQNPCRLDSGPHLVRRLVAPGCSPSSRRRRDAPSLVPTLPLGCPATGRSFGAGFRQYGAYDGND
jgi:hypothetical protein